MFDWKELYALAVWLKDNANSGVSEEAVYRSAVGRAYFGAFCYARNYAMEFLDFEVSENADDHSSLRRHLKNKKRFQTSQSLDRLRRWRNECDYSDTLHGDLTTTLASALKDAEYVFTSLSPPAARTDLPSDS